MSARAGELAVLLRACRQGANAAEKAGRQAEADLLRERAAELALEARAIAAARDAKARAEAQAYWDLLSQRMVADLLTLATELRRL